MRVDVDGALALFGDTSNIVDAARKAGVGHIITRHAVLKWKARGSMPLRSYAALTIAAKAIGKARVGLHNHIRIVRRNA